MSSARVVILLKVVANLLIVILVAVSDNTIIKNVKKVIQFCCKDNLSF